MYLNYKFVVPPNDYGTTMGNPQIEAQKTIQYEVGLWMQLMRGMNLELAVFYRDIYDLQTAKVITTYNQIEYGLYSNKDYGNVKGLEIKLASGEIKGIYGGISYVWKYPPLFRRGKCQLH